MKTLRNLMTVAQIIVMVGVILSIGQKLEILEEWTNTVTPHLYLAIGILAASIVVMTGRYYIISEGTAKIDLDKNLLLIAVCCLSCTSILFIAGQYNKMIMIAFGIISVIATTTIIIYRKDLKMHHYLLWVMAVSIPIQLLYLKVVSDKSESIVLIIHFLGVLIVIGWIIGLIKVLKKLNY